MQLNRSYNIRVKDSVINPNMISLRGINEGLYKKTSADSKPLYKVWLYLEGDDLIFVKKAKYILHSSFKKPIHVVERSASNQNCSLVIWTWGLFNVKVEIEDINGRKFNLEHYMSYGSEIESKKINWKEANK